MLLKINHPNCIRCLDVIKSENQCYIVTELCDGGDLDMYAKKRGFLSEDEVAPFLKDILEGLIYLASLNIVHRDLKVANVFIHKKQAKIADFGFAVINRYQSCDEDKNSKILTLGRLSICLLRAISTACMALKLTYGPLGFSSTNFCMEIPPFPTAN